ncbi:MAG: aminoacetone oxidase family FAD-binding enzyme [Anaerolineae bacterium]|nr:aminoacetone oxidase family FAD-binding enzyme [Anaerolineae bacterium]
MLDNQVFDFVVIGGGAAGFFGAAVFAAARPGSRCVILEASDHPLAKVRISGGGRCNVTHACFEPADLVKFYPRGSRELLGAFNRFQPRDTMRWFEQRGVPLKTEADGRVFPQSDSSQSILDCLNNEIDRLGVRLITRSKVTHLERSDTGQLIVEINRQETLHTHGLLLACGGTPASFSLAQQLGHTIQSPVPSLFTFSIRDPRIDGLPGVSVSHAALSLPETRRQVSGPVLITHWGLSGPGVLRLSAWGARDLFERQYRTALRINWLPDYNPESAAARLEQIRTTEARRQVQVASPFAPIPQRLWHRLVAAAGIAEGTLWANLPRRHLLNLADQLTRGEFQIQGKGQFKDEFVTCGGVNLAEVDFRSMESKVCPRLYLAGEMLDVDGLTGGFNFQNAWTTAWIAGISYARRQEAVK